MSSTVADVDAGFAPDFDENRPPDINPALAFPDNRFPFDAMRLKVGDRLQMQLPLRFSNERVIVKLIGYLHNVSLLTTPPRDASGFRHLIEEGETLFVRVFTSLNAFAFATTVEKVVKHPFEYLHLAFPAEVQGMTIRKAPRVKIKIICSFTRQSAADASATGVLANLSANGALLATRSGLLEKDDAIRLSFRMLLHGSEVMLNLSATVRSQFSDENSPKQESSYYGLEFNDTKPSDTMALQSMVYQQMIEQPQTVI